MGRQHAAKKLRAAVPGNLNGQTACCQVACYCTWKPEWADSMPRSCMLLYLETLMGRQHAAKKLHAAVP